MSHYVQGTLGYTLFLATRSTRGVRFLDVHEKATYLPYAQLWERACCTAGSLHAAGLRPGDRVALALPTAPAFYDAFFGALVAGGVPVPLAPPPAPGELGDYLQQTSRMLQAVEATLLVTTAKARRLLAPLLPLVQLPLGCMLIDRCSPARIRIAALTPDDTALILFSSGTALDPQPVQLTHRQVLANVQAITETIAQDLHEDPASTHVVVSWLPLHHNLGLIGAVLIAAALPCDLILLAPEQFAARPAAWLRAISRYGATISLAPNSAYSHCLEHAHTEELQGLDLSSWRLALNGSEAVIPGTLKRFAACYRRYGLRPEALSPLYGLAEATLAVTCTAPRQPATVRLFHSELLAATGRAVPAQDGLAMVSVGRPLPGFELRIVDELGRPVAEGVRGRVFVRGPSVMQGYYNDPAATRATLVEGWLDTGDTGFLFDGELFLHGSAKDLIMLDGHAYAPQQLEQAADEVPGVHVGGSAAISSLLGDEDRQMLFLFVERARQRDSADDEQLAEAVARHVAQRTGLHVNRVVILDSATLPRTVSGKLRREETLRRYLARELVAPPKFSWRALATDVLRSLWTQLSA